MKTHTMPPAASVPRKNMASVCSGMAVSALERFGGVERGVERGGEALFLAVVARAVPKPRPADAGGAMAADQLALGVLAQDFIEEQVLGDDHVALHAHHFGQVGDAARAVAQPGGLDDQIDRGA